MTVEMKKSSWFTHFAKATAWFAGRPIAFIAAVLIVIVWGVTGPLFEYSDTWQLVINTGTTIVTFLMVFLIQNTQNRDSQALQLKIDELIRAIGAAHNEMLDMEERDDEELEKMRAEYQQLARSKSLDSKDCEPPTTDEAEADSATETADRKES